MFDVPVFWPILLLYWIVLFALTMKRQIRHMIKYKYVPFSFGKQVISPHMFNEGNDVYVIYLISKFLFSVTAMCKNMVSQIVASLQLHCQRMVILHRLCLRTYIASSHLGCFLEHLVNKKNFIMYFENLLYDMSTQYWSFLFLQRYSGKKSSAKASTSRD
jgi:hypothetical protein